MDLFKFSVINNYVLHINNSGMTKLNSSKKIIFLFVIGFFCSFTLPPCDPEALLKKCAPELADFVFIKTFNIESKKDGEKTEYSYVLSRGSVYRIVVGDEEGTSHKMIVNLLDRNKKLIATNYLKSGKKFFPVLNYECAATGVYYVEAFFDGEKKGCGINILGFKK